MSHIEEWATLIAKQLKSEAELVSTQAKSELYEDVARDTFIRVVLKPFLPSSYAVGSGRVIDSSGNISSDQDIVIYRRDYPQFNMPGSHHVFIYESVLATIQTRSKLVRKSFSSALDQCASMGTLNPLIDSATLRGMASRMKMQLNARQQYVHPNPLMTCRFNLIGRPQSFIYAFTGIQTSDRQLEENLEKWIELYNPEDNVLEMKSLPSVIATQGCFAWRNTAPFAIKERALMCVGIDHAPLRLIILQLMHALNRRLQNTSDGYGIKSNIAAYLAQFEPPAFSRKVGTAFNRAISKQATANTSIPKKTGGDERQPVAAQAHAAKEESTSQQNAEVLNLDASGSRDVSSASDRPTMVEPKNHSETQTDEYANQPSVQLVQSSVSQRRQKTQSLDSIRPTGDADTASGPEKTEAESKKQNEIEKELPSPARAKTGKENTVIKNLSMKQPAKRNIKENKSAEGRNLPRPGNPLSSFNGGTQGDVEDYQLNPIDTSLNRSEGEGPVKESDSDDRYIDTLVGTAKSLAQDNSEQASDNSKYVTETLI